MIFSSADRRTAEILVELNATNPFAPERLTLESQLVGSPPASTRSARSRNPTIPELSLRERGGLRRAEEVLRRTRQRLARRDPQDELPERDVERYENTALFTLYHRWFDPLTELARTAERSHSRTASRSTSQGAPRELAVPWYDEFRGEVRDTLRPGGRRLSLDPTPAHLLALFFQIARAFHQIYSNILGTSTAAIRLRAAVWQSIFTHDIRRYQRALYDHTHELTTLITGPSGTGKELVAGAIGLAGYLPFDEKARVFRIRTERFQSLNLSALAPNLIESELFGTTRGAYTGAVADRRGWFESCPRYGTLFLDEIGEISGSTQVKLLRVLQTRQFQRLGETRTRPFQAKLVSATNRDLDQAMQEGRLREDFYYRICSDRIQTPSLAEQIDGSLDELRIFVTFVVQNLIGEDSADLSDEVIDWVSKQLGRDYAWPGNFRELEQCVSSIVVRREYRPRRIPTSVHAELSETFRAGEASADEVLRNYCTLVYARCGSFDGAARVLGLDRRTVKARVDPELLERLTKER